MRGSESPLYQAEAGKVAQKNRHVDQDRSRAIMGRHVAFQLAGQPMMTNLEPIGDCTDQVEIYTEAALKHGATEDEILAVVNHVASFAGTPRAVKKVRRIAPRLTTSRKFKPPREKTTRLSDHDTLTREYGSEAEQTPIILIHALSMDGRMFQKVVPRLALEGSRVITYDLRGHGYSRGPPLTESLDHLAEDLKLLVDALQIEKAVVYGASYGGAVAQYFTLALTTRVRSLCAMATSAQGHPLLASRATRAEEGHMKELLVEAIVRWFLPENVALNPWYVRYARTNIEQVRVEEWAAAWRAMAALNCLHRIPEIQVPILALAGKQDASAIPAVMKPIKEAAKDGSYVELDPGTHMMAMEQPEAVSNALSSFRKQVDEKFPSRGQTSFSPVLINLEYSDAPFIASNMCLRASCWHNEIWL